MKKIIILFLMVAVFATVIIGAVRKPQMTTDTYTVKSGDSLWSIASEYCPNEIRTQEYIDLIREANGMHGSVIYPGQILTIFIESEG